MTFYLFSIATKLHISNLPTIKLLRKGALNRRMRVRQRRVHGLLLPGAGGHHLTLLRERTFGTRAPGGLTLPSRSGSEMSAEYGTLLYADSQYTTLLAVRSEKAP